MVNMIPSVGLNCRCVSYPVVLHPPGSGFSQQLFCGCQGWRENQFGPWCLQMMLLAKPVGCCQQMREREHRAYSSIFWYINPSCPTEKCNSCLAVSVRRHFLPNYGSCVMNNCTESPSAAGWPVCWACYVLCECHINKEMGYFLFSFTLCHFK